MISRNALSEFDEWLVENWEVKYPDTYLKGKILSQYQNIFVCNNAILLCDRQLWEAKIAKFNAALESIDPPADREPTRKKYMIRFDHHNFETNGDNFDFRNYVFPCPVSFKGINFGNGDVSFEGVQFQNGEVSFENAAFNDGNVSFSNVQLFNGIANFTNTTFGNGSILFDAAKFQSGLLFINTKFGNGDVSFQGTIFRGVNVQFEDATFGKGKVSFGNPPIFNGVGL